MLLAPPDPMQLMRDQCKKIISRNFNFGKLQFWHQCQSVEKHFDDGGSNCSLAWATDGHIICHSINSSYQSAATSQQHPRVLRDRRCSVKKLNCIRHLRPLDAFSRLLVGPKYTCGWGSPRPLADELPPPRTPPALSLRPRIFALQAWVP